jgi:hypothetical protein
MLDSDVNSFINKVNSSKDIENIRCTFRSYNIDINKLTEDEVNQLFKCLLVVVQ